MAHEVIDRPVDRSRASQKRREIIDCAATLFDRNGYQSTSMEDIAAAVGIRKPTLYHYVASKDEILHRIHDEFIDLIISRHRSRLGTEMTVSQHLLEIIADILELMHTHRAHVRVFFEHHRELAPEERASVEKKRAEYASMVEDVIREGVENGELRAVNVRLATLALFGMCNWAYQWYRVDGPIRSREIAYEFWGIFLRGLQPAPTIDIRAAELETDDVAPR